MTYTPEELTEMLAKMRAASSAFYRDAVRTGESALAQGLDFTETSVHGSGKPLPMQFYHRAYLNEKLECIYGTSLDALTGPKRI